MSFPTRMRRSEASNYLKQMHGVRYAPQTLAKLASIGGGPKFEKIGNLPFYRPEWLNDWVAARLSRPVNCTSELGPTDAA